MSENSSALETTGSQSIPPASAFGAPVGDARDGLRRAAAAVMEIQDVTYGAQETPLRIRGRLTVPSEEAFNQLRPQYEAAGFTPQMRREDDLDVIRALPVVYSRLPHHTPWVAIILLIATVVSVFFVGLQGELYAPATQIIIAKLTHNAGLVRPDLMPTDADFGKALITGGLYVLALMGILGSHEMGHYLVARHHKVQTTVPFFIPLPFNILGTLGAVIAMREPSPNRRIQFDIGIAGPIAGLIVTIPVMIIGLLLSQVESTQQMLASMPQGVGTAIIHEGQSIAYLAFKFVVFGRILPQGNLDVWVHPVAFAAWAGLLVTMLNLLPVGQLDGGHILYGLFGDKADLARWPIIGVLVVMALAGTLTDFGIVSLPFGWSGWWIWVLFMVFLLKHHAPVLDEITGLDMRRKALGVVMLIVFVLIFTPRPLVIDASPLAMLFGLFRM